MGGPAGGKVQVWQGQQELTAGLHRRETEVSLKLELVLSSLGYPRGKSADLPLPMSVLTQFRFPHAFPSSVSTSCGEIPGRTTDDFAQTGFLARFQLFEKNKEEELWFCSGALCWREEGEEKHLP